MSTSDVTYRWLGIDVSKDSLDVYAPNPPSSTRYKNNREGIDQLWQALSERSDWAVVCEASGGYETLMATTLALTAVGSVWSTRGQCGTLPKPVAF